MRRHREGDREGVQRQRSLFDVTQPDMADLPCQLQDVLDHGISRQKQRTSSVCTKTGIGGCASACGAPALTAQAPPRNYVGTPLTLRRRRVLTHEGLSLGDLGDPRGLPRGGTRARLASTRTRHRQPHGVATFYHWFGHRLSVCGYRLFVWFGQPFRTTHWRC